MVGCGGVLAELPFDGDAGCVHESTALAIAHAGADLFDLVGELVRLRSALERSNRQAEQDREDLVAELGRERAVVASLQGQLARVEQGAGAVGYVLERAQQDPTGLGYHLGPYAEAWERLVRFEAVLLGVDPTELRQRRAARGTP